MNGLSLGLHPLAYALDNSSSDLQSTGNSGSALDWTLNNSSRSDNWTPEAWNWKFQTLPRFELPPPFYTIFTHLLSHSDDRHYLNNMASIVSSAWTLNLGFWKSFGLFIGSGISGALALALQKAWSDHQSSQIPVSALPNLVIPIYNNNNNNNSFFSGIWQTVQDFYQDTVSSLPILTFPGFAKVYSVCGSSGSAFGFMGVECWWVYDRLSRIWSSKYTKLQRFRAEQEMAHVMLYAVSVGFRVSLMLHDVFWQDSLDADHWTSYFSTTPTNMTNHGVGKVGHAAHFGGFLFGIVFGGFFIKD